MAHRRSASHLLPPATPGGTARTRHSARHGPAGARDPRRGTGRARTRPARRHRTARHRTPSPPRCRAPADRGRRAAASAQTRRWSRRGLAGHRVERRVADVDPGDRPEHTRGPVVVGQLAPLDPRRSPGRAPSATSAGPGVRQAARAAGPPRATAPRREPRWPRSSSRLACGHPSLEDGLGRERVVASSYGRRPVSVAPARSGTRHQRPSWARSTSTTPMPARDERRHAAPPRPAPTARVVGVDDERHAVDPCVRHGASSASTSLGRRSSLGRAAAGRPARGRSRAAPKVSMTSESLRVEAEHDRHGGQEVLRAAGGERGGHGYDGARRRRRERRPRARPVERPAPGARCGRQAGRGRVPGRLSDARR